MIFFLQIFETILNPQKVKFISHDKWLLGKPFLKETNKGPSKF